MQACSSLSIIVIVKNVRAKEKCERSSTNRRLPNADFINNRNTTNEKKKKNKNIVKRQYWANIKYARYTDVRCRWR